jgi:DNA-binding XRE family transcriptional regulator
MRDTFGWVVDNIRASLSWAAFFVSGAATCRFRNIFAYYFSMPRGRIQSSEAQRERARRLQERLKARREELDMELEPLARRAKVHRRTLDKYFEGESPSPSFFLIAELADALELSLDELARLVSDDAG